MSSTSAPDPESALAWFRIALGDLAGACALADDDGVPPRLAAALAQQAAEKALKAVIALAGIDPPRTHDLVSLALDVRSRGLTIPDAVDLAALSDGVRSGRYPDPDETPTERSVVIDLVAGARIVLDVVRGHLEANGVEADFIREGIETITKR